MKFKSYVVGLFVAFLALAVFSPQAWAIGPASGATISNVAAVEWRTGAVTDSTQSTANDTPIKRVAGDTLSDPGNQSLGVGETKVFTYTFTNTGNGTDTFQVWLDSFLLTGGADTWRITLYVGTESTLSLNDTKTTTAVAADGTYSCSVAVWANSNPDSSPNGSAGEFRLRIKQGNQANADSTGQYTGDNGTTYATGSAGDNDTSKATVSSANITLVKDITAVTLGGSASLPIPGATIQYRLTYNNTGGAAGDSVSLRDSIPLYTVFDTASRNGAALGASATFADADSGQTGWALQVSTSTTPDQSYGSSSYQSIVTYTGAMSAVKWVRWVRQTVAAAETANLVFRVRIQ